MTDEAPAMIGLEEIEEHEDGSATYKLHMDDRSRMMVINEGLKFLFACAAHKVDLAEVYDWIASHKETDDENS